VYVAVDRPLTQICTSPITSGVPGGCHFEARDAPQMSTGLPGTIGTKKYIEFEGRLISKHACTPNASHDVVLARKRWTMCCESVGTGVVASCAEGGPPQFPPLQFSSSQEVGPRGACLLFAKVNGSVLVFAIVDVSPQLPLGAGAVVLTVSGSNAIEADDGPFEVSMFEGDVTDAYFPFRLAAPVSGVVTATIDIFGEQATWQVDLTPLGLGPVGYCTPGTTTNGCTAVIASAGTPSSAASSGFVLSSSGIEGQRGGLIFYGVNGRNSIPWKPGSTSFLCVKSPTQRMLLLNSGGTSGACNGAFATDFLAFLAANPTSLGQPFASGNVCDAQAWFRDPSAPGTTNLSNAIEWTMLP
jgi:hypothetical protein